MRGRFRVRRYLCGASCKPNRPLIRRASRATFPREGGKGFARFLAEYMGKADNYFGD